MKKVLLSLSTSEGKSNLYTALYFAAMLVGLYFIGKYGVI